MFTFNKLSRLHLILVAVVAAIAATGCIENDIPYPRIHANFLKFEVENGTTTIDSTSTDRVITVTLNEYADIQAVKVTDWEISQGAKFPDEDILNSPLNLTEPIEVTLSIFQDYVWKIVGVQNIERYFTIGSQIGSAEIDAKNHTVKAYVPTGQALDNILVKTIKLAGPLAVMTPDLANEHVDFTNPVTVSVEEFGRTTEWTISVETTDVSVSLARVDAWTMVAWLYGEAEEGKANGFEYRLASEDEWTVVPKEWITTDGGSFVGRLLHLQPMATYVARAISDDEHSAEIEFTTGTIIQLPNNNFQNWNLQGKTWYANAAGAEVFWDSGNKGATTIGQSNTVPIDDSASPTGYNGAKLESKFVGALGIGKFAAGNLFAGDFVKADGMNGILDFGRLYNQHPTGATVRLKYTTANISDVSKSNPDFQYMKGQPDTCIVWMALADWDAPLNIRTKPSDRNLFNRDNEGVIAYGQFESGSSIDDYIDVKFELEYKDTYRIPRYLLFTMSASKYGDYFTGARGATLYIESVTLNYDYD